MHSQGPSRSPGPIKTLAGLRLRPSEESMSGLILGVGPRRPTWPTRVVKSGGISGPDHFASWPRSLIALIS